MREFNIKLNEEVLKRASEGEVSIDEMNKAMKVADEILEVFRKNKTTMDDAYFTLTALADSIYMYSVFGEELLD